MRAGFSVQILDPPDARHTLNLESEQSITVGRDASCDVVLPSRAVSRFHLRVEHRDDCVVLVDQSSNGTLVGDAHVCARSVPLPPRAPVRIGPYVLAISRSAAAGEVTPEVRRRIHRSLLDQLNLAALDSERVKSAAMRRRVVRSLERIVESLEPVVVSAGSRERLVSEMADEVLGLGPLQGLLEDDEVSEIMVVDPETIYVERDGRLEQTTLRFIDEESCRAAIERIVTPLGRRIDESTPLVDARLDDGSRVNAVIPPLAIRGPCITIRKFTSNRLAMNDLVTRGALSEQMASFLRRCVRARKNVVISGGTGSGKTTLLNILSTDIPSFERIVTIEDAAELQLDQPHVVSLESKPMNLEGHGEYTIRDLLKNALRMRPDRILVGECRAGEAIDMLQAMNTGHEGSMTTTHANSVREAIKRIETLCLLSGLDLPIRVIREQMATSLHIIVQQARFADGSRRITSIAEVCGVGPEGELHVEELFTFVRHGTARNGRVIGEHQSTGYVPTFVADFIRQGLADEGGFL